MVDLGTVEISPDTLALIPRSTASELNVLPLGLEGDVLSVAVAEGSITQALSDLEFVLGRPVRGVPVAGDALREGLQRFYGISPGEADRTGSAESQFVLLEEAEGGEGSEARAPGKRETDGSIIALVNQLVTEAIRLGASDIHVEPYERDLRIRYRLDGVLHEIAHPPQEKARALISRLKIMADLDIAEKRRPQDGRIRVKEGEKVIDIRVSSLPTDFGEKIVLRILDKSALRLDLAGLGFSCEDLRLFERTIRLPYGMILVTGPTGSGKTTTLYAALNSINRPEINITTIEDPIEYNLAGINQTHVRADIGLTFAAVLRSILRQDPNVIMLGEIRDTETAQIAIRAALTGHLVFSTLHTNDAPSALTRLIDMGVEPFLVASSVKMILAQRLLRNVCLECAASYELRSDEREELIGLAEGLPASLKKGRGCRLCSNTGYKGRSAVFEVLSVNNGLADLIAHNALLSEIRSKAKAGGMRTLREAALAKALAGETSIEEVLRETVA
jgi:type IV pilus assembly protein PilB